MKVLLIEEGLESQQATKELAAAFQRNKDEVVIVRTAEEAQRAQASSSFDVVVGQARTLRTTILRDPEGEY